MSSSKIYGISFDVEDTLISTKNIPCDQHYQIAFELFSNRTKKQALQQPEWLRNNDADARKKLFNDAWMLASKTRNEVRKNHPSACAYSNDDHAENGFQVEHVNSFYRAVVQHFFQFPDDIDQDLLDEFVAFLVHDYWVSERAYALPARNVEKLIEIKERFPDVPMFIVSNTDHRVVKALHLFPIYRDVFNDEAKFVTASNVPWIFDDAIGARVPGVKPYPTGIQACMIKSGFAAGQRQQHQQQQRTDKKWLHVGDSAKEDGLAAERSGALFLHCAKGNGVDFEKVLEMLV